MLRFELYLFQQRFLCVTTLNVEKIYRMSEYSTDQHSSGAQLSVVVVSNPSPVGLGAGDEGSREGTGSGTSYNIFDPRQEPQRSEIFEDLSADYQSGVLSDGGAGDVGVTDTEALSSLLMLAETSTTKDTTTEQQYPRKNNISHSDHGPNMVWLFTYLSFSL